MPEQGDCRGQGDGARPGVPGKGAFDHDEAAADLIGIPGSGGGGMRAAGGYPYACGKTWNAYAFSREILGNFKKRKADGRISVEPECFAIQAMCDFRELNFYMFLAGSDLPDAPVWDARGMFDRPTGMISGILGLARNGRAYSGTQIAQGRREFAFRAAIKSPNNLLLYWEKGKRQKQRFSQKLGLFPP